MGDKAALAGEQLGSGWHACGSCDLPAADASRSRSEQELDTHRALTGMLTGASSPRPIPHPMSTAVVAADGPGRRDTCVMDIISNHLDMSGCPQKHKPRAHASLRALAGNQLSIAN